MMNTMGIKIILFPEDLIIQTYENDPLSSILVIGKECHSQSNYSVCHSWLGWTNDSVILFNL